MTAPRAFTQLQQPRVSGDRAPPRQTDAPHDTPHGAGGFRIGALFGVEIRVDWSLLLIFGLIVFNLGAAAFPQWHPDWSPLLVWSLAVAAALLFFGSVLAHELSHALVARSQGTPVRRITLFLFGGVTQLESEPGSPKDEFWMAVVGPITSLTIGLLASFAGTWLASRVVSFETLRNPAGTALALQSVGPAATLLLWLGPLNVTLAIFNMVPGFPLDGGRVLRSLLWWKTGDLMKATRWASLSGRLFAGLLMAFGVFQLFTGNVGQGIWLLLIGWFLNNTARASYRQLWMRHALDALPIQQVMRTDVESVPPALRVEEFVRRLMAREQRGFPVEEDGRLLGIVCFDDVRKVAQAQWAQVEVRDIMTSIERLTTLPADADAEQALAALTGLEVDQIPVVEQGRLLGLVRRADLLKWMALHGAPAAA